VLAHDVEDSLLDEPDEPGSDPEDPDESEDPDDPDAGDSDFEGLADFEDEDLLLLLESVA
jgi:hypothetical protein